MVMSHNGTTHTKSPKYDAIHTWCKPSYCTILNKQGFNISNIYTCKFGSTCRGAHSKEMIRCKPEILAWKRKDKTNVNIYEIYKNILDVVDQFKDMVKNPKYTAVLSNGKYKTFTFKQLTNFWFDITCYHRGIAKELPHAKEFNKTNESIEGFQTKDSVPMFFLQNEDDVWSIERTLHLCPHYIYMLSNSHKQLTPDKICCGDMNCKYGEDDILKVACEKDYMDGNCDCKSMEQIKKEKQRIISEIEIIKKELVSSIDSDGYAIVINKKIREEKNQNIISLEKEYNKLYRMIHYTEQGMIPFNILKKKEDDMIEVERLRLEEIAKNVKKVISVKKKNYTLD